MYYHNSDFKKLLKNDTSEKEYTDILSNNMRKIIDCINDSEIYYDEIGSDESSENESFVNFRNINQVVADTVKTLRLLEKKNITTHKNKKNVSKIAKLVVFDIFVEKIKLDEKYVIKLLDFVNWNCELLLKLGGDFASSEEDGGFCIAKLLDLAKKYKRSVTNYRNYETVYCLLMAVSHCEGKRAKRFIIRKKIKLPKDMADENDGMFDDMIEYFNEKKYDLLQ